MTRKINSNYIQVVICQLLVLEVFYFSLELLLQELGGEVGPGLWTLMYLMIRRWAGRSGAWRRAGLFRDSTTAAGRCCFRGWCRLLEVRGVQEVVLLLLTVKELVSCIGLDCISVQVAGGLAGWSESCWTRAVIDESERVQANAKVEDLAPASTWWVQTCSWFAFTGQSVFSGLEGLVAVVVGVGGGVDVDVERDCDRLGGAAGACTAGGAGFGGWGGGRCECGGERGGVVVFAGGVRVGVDWGWLEVLVVVVGDDFVRWLVKWVYRLDGRGWDERADGETLVLVILAAQAQT